MTLEQQPPTPKTSSLFESQIFTFLKLRLLDLTERYPGVKAIKAEMIKSKVSSPKELPRSVRLKTAKGVLQPMKDAGELLRIDPIVNMVGAASIFNYYGYDVIIDLINEGYVEYTAIDQTDKIKQMRIQSAIDEGWTQD